jgi:hypothetical protein
MLWIVELETASPDDGILVENAFKDSIRLLGGDLTTASVDLDGWVMRFEIEASDAQEALSFATIRTFAAAELARLPQWPIIAIQVLNAEYASATRRGFEST